MDLPRRGLAFLAAAGAIGAAAAVRPARAAPAAIPDVVAYCDPTLRHAITEAGRDFGHPVHVFCAPPTLMIAQLERIVQNDVLITQPGAMDDAARRDLIVTPTRAAIGGTTLVLAGRAGRIGPVATDPAAIAALLGEDGRLAVTDPSRAATIDGAGVLAALGWSEALHSRLIGAANEGDVAFLVATGTARLGLLHMTDVRADPRLAVVTRLPKTASIDYDAAVSRLAKSPNAAAFVAHLREPAAIICLRDAGLTVPA